MVSFESRDAVPCSTDLGAGVAVFASNESFGSVGSDESLVVLYVCPRSFEASLVGVLRGESVGEEVLSCLAIGVATAKKQCAFPLKTSLKQRQRFLVVRAASQTMIQLIPFRA